MTTPTQRLALADPSKISTSIRWGIYCRISKDRTGAGLGVERQENEVRAVLPETDIVVDVYVDNDISAASGKPRPEYERLLEDLRTGRINGVATWHNDRLHRRPLELEAFIDLCESKGATVRTAVAGQYDLTTPSGRFTARIIGATARVEWENARERRKTQLKQQAEKGGNHGGGRRYGRNLDMTPREGEAEVIREITRRHLNGESLNALARDLNKREVPTVKGTAWRASNLGRTLRAAHVVGLRIHRGAMYTASWEPILDSDTYQSLITLLDDPTRSTNAAGGAPKHEFTRLIRCGLCGSQMVPNHPQGGKRGWACRKTRGGCGKIARLAEPMETYLLKEFFAYVEQPGLLAGIAQSGAVDTTALLAQLDAAKSQRLEAEVARYAPGGGLRSLSDEAYQIVMAQHDQVIADLNREIRSVTPKAVLTMADLVDNGALRTTWLAMDLADRRTLLRAFIDRVEVLPVGIGTKKYTSEECYRLVWLR